MNERSLSCHIAIYMVALVLTSSCTQYSGGYAPSSTASSVDTTAPCSITTECTDPTNVTVTTLTPDLADGFTDIGVLGTDGTYIYIGGYALRRYDPTTNSAVVLAGSTTVSGYVNAVGESARFSSIGGISYDGTNLLLTDKYNHVVRKYEMSSGTVSFVSGTPQEAGYRDTAGLPAQYNELSGIVAIGAETFIADTKNSTIRRIAAQGYTLTHAGSATNPRDTTDGLGTSARFAYPAAMVQVGKYLYIADSSNHTIRRLALATKRVTAFAGTPGVEGRADGIGTAASFSFPTGITTDGSNLFVADTNNNLIRKIHIATAAVTTLAGTGADVFSNEDGAGNVATLMDPRSIIYLNNALYVSCGFTKKLRVIR